MRTQISDHLGLAASHFAPRWVRAELRHGEVIRDQAGAQGAQRTPSSFASFAQLFTATPR